MYEEEGYFPDAYTAAKFCTFCGQALPAPTHSPNPVKYDAVSGKPYYSYEKKCRSWSHAQQKHDWLSKEALDEKDLPF